MLVDFYPWDIWMSSYNMQAQMMGSYNLSFYRLGDNILNLIQDTKSRESFYYRATDKNYTRNALYYDYNNHSWYMDNRESTTYQTYIFMTTFK